MLRADQSGHSRLALPTRGSPPQLLSAAAAFRELCATHTWRPPCGPTGLPRGFSVSVTEHPDVSQEPLLSGAPVAVNALHGVA